MRLVLIGDIHAGRRWAAPWRLVGKRLLGMANMWLNRHRRFELSQLDDVLARAADQRPDMVLGSGDLSTTALPTEFEDVARRWQAHLRDVPTWFVPGNHDRYTFASKCLKTMEHHFAGAVPETFPAHQALNEAWHLLMIDGAVPRLAVSRGRLGRRQCTALDTALASIPRDDGVVLMCHYPFAVPADCPDHWDHRLADAAALRRCLARHRRRMLFLHGHVHRPWCLRPEDPALAHVVAINAGSPTHSPHGHGFWQIDLPDRADAPVTLVRHEPGPITEPAPQAGAAVPWRAIRSELNADGDVSPPPNTPQ